MTDSLITDPMLESFHRCQICGYESTDICEFTMWYECDDQDQPIKDRVLVTCKPDGCAHDNYNPDACYQKVKDHPRLYVEVPWSRGEPGHIILCCEKCKFRAGATCRHPNLRKNGGPGLELLAYNFMPASVVVCFFNPESEHGLSCRRLERPFQGCRGFSPK